MESSVDSNKNFFQYVFNFDNDSKTEILNIIQYALIAIIPIVILNKTMSRYVPEADDKKGSVELVAEIVAQIIVIFMSIFLIHRIITFIPTYSGAKYPEYNVIVNILAILMITMSLQTKLGEKVNILVDRVVELWEGTTGNNVKKKKNSNQQGQSQGQGQAPMQNSMQTAITQSLYSDGTSINALPANNNTTSTQQMPDYNNMYRQDTTQMVGAATPGGTEGFTSEPMAANSVLGGGAFGSW
jgi:hypothetical protein